ncbi:DUF2382 domain-containing protein [Blastococcus sp. MG754426]|uniref:DUF2382 domain-containing protein n=1 Tax=unclassified Blastococcus TaxID=2619396 RepID=UPI001EF1318F|nr:MULTISPECIES: PRC and DUF2382 domain-containing protein [unclassified Blastococcus]MCF6509695.1 DUF2382 domain-containing protein [Blastococcus sp. MG754426]MCF6512219.1 DUF2382 domain-containing protein [Blastococcus sp. MG754427]MCF6735797.1 DUF2382 domain-containing protein [Blastococcus sp. KM273129]
MLSQHEVTAAIGSTAYGDGGDKLGTVEHFFVDDRTGEPTWVAVTTGLFGTRQSIVPAREASWEDGRLRVPVTAEAVTSAPAMEGTHLDPGDEAELRRHYGLAGEPAGAAGGRQRERDGTGAAGTGAPGTAGHTPGAMTRSEERLQVGTEQVAARRVRLVKYVVTEEVQVTVPVRREEIRLEEVPMEGTGTAADDTARDHGVEESLVAEGTATSGLPDEIVLHAERPVFGVEVVPVERVRLRTEVVEGRETVTEQVLREQITVDREDAPRA